MDSNRESRALFIIAFAATLFGIIAPYRWHTIPPFFSGGAIVVAEILSIFGVWLVAPPKVIKHRVPNMIAILVIILGVAITAYGVVLLVEHPPVSLITQKPKGTASTSIPPPETQKIPSADEIASAIAGKSRVQDQFLSTLSQPVTGIYAVLTLSSPVTGDDLNKLAFVVQMTDRGPNKAPTLLFGARPDKHEWTKIPGNEKIYEQGMRCEVWTFPSQSKQEDQPTIIDNFLVFRIEKLNRLEAGAIMASPFSAVKNVDNALVLIKASPLAAHLFEKLSIIVNDYVVFEVTKEDIVSWSPPAPTFKPQIVHGHLDSTTGILTPKEVKELPIVNINNFMFPDNFKDIPFYTAHFSPKIACMPNFANNSTYINLAQFDVRIHRMNKGWPHKAGTGSMTITPGQEGWLPSE